TLAGSHPTARSGSAAAPARPCEWRDRPSLTVGLASCTWVQVYRRSVSTTDNANDWVPDACTLPTAERPLRVAEFDALFADHLASVSRVSRTTVDLTLAGEAQAAAAELIARETECCSFFRFEIAPTPDDLVRLRIAVPPTQVAVLDALSALAAE